MNFRRLVMSELLVQSSRLILSVGGPEFTTDEVPEQLVVSSFFFRLLKIFCPHVVAFLLLPARWREIITRIERRN